MTAPISIATVVDALGLPPSARVDMRVPKKMLAEQAASTAADKRIISDGIDELQWFAACKPSTIGVPSFKDDIHEYLEIAAVGCAFRPGAKTTRLVELIHRSIPYPVLLATSNAEGVALSLAHKRPAEREAGRIVSDRVVSTGPIGGTEVDQAFLASLALVRQPRQNLNALYDGWFARVEALQAAQVTGAYWATDDKDAVQRRREALETHTRLQRDIASVRAKAGREKQMKGRVDLNLQIQRLQAALADLNTKL